MRLLGSLDAMKVLSCMTLLMSLQMICFSKYRSPLLVKVDETTKENWKITNTIYIAV